MSNDIVYYGTLGALIFLGGVLLGGWGMWEFMMMEDPSLKALKVEKGPR